MLFGVAGQGLLRSRSSSRHTYTGEGEGEGKGAHAHRTAWHLVAIEAGRRVVCICAVEGIIGELQGAEAGKGMYLGR